MKEITLEAVIENIPGLTAKVDEALEALDASPKAQMQIDVAIDEIFGNIARYAYAPGAGKATVRLEYDAATGTAVLTFIDRGVPFNPTERSSPDTTLPAEERQIGGLGIFLVRKTMDAMEYRREDGQNILTLRKRIRA